MLPTISTDRLILRKFTADDTEAVFSAFSVSSFTEPMLIDRQPDYYFAESYIEEILSGYSNDTCYTWAVADRNTDVCIGAVSLSDIKNNGAEIGYWITNKSQGNGYAKEAVRAVVKYAFEYMLLHRLWAKCRIDNAASLRVLKCSDFRLEGIAKDEVFRKGEYVSIAYLSLISKN